MINSAHQQRRKKRKYHSLLSDDEAVAWMADRAKISWVDANRIAQGFRKKAIENGVACSTKIHSEVQPGCVFKRDIPRIGPTCDNFKYLRGWSFPDPPTEHCLVSWISSPLTCSSNKTAAEQMEMMRYFKLDAGLPAWYELSFGSVNHLAGMMSAYYRAVGRFPHSFAGLMARTDTRHEDGDRLWLGLHEDHLYCGCFDRDGHRDSRRAVFAVGVVKALIK